MATSRQLSRIDGVTRSPIYANFGETINGVATIRAYNRQTAFIESVWARKRGVTITDQARSERDPRGPKCRAIFCLAWNQPMAGCAVCGTCVCRCELIYHAISSLETIGNLIMFFAAMFAVIQRDTVDPGLVGLALSYALSVTSVSFKPSHIL